MFSMKVYHKFCSLNICSSFSAGSIYEGDKRTLQFITVRSAYIRSYSGPYFPAFQLNRIQSECGKIPTRITPNTDTFYAVYAK